MTERPLVSIVTPCLNPGSRLQRCIDSVRAQTYRNIEQIVIDGGSTDGTVDLLRATEEIKWVSEPDTGQTAAINKGFRLATGEILSWLNADDELKPASTETAVRALLGNNAGWIYGDLEVVQGKQTRILTPSSDPSRDLFDLGKGGVIPQPGTFIRKEALARVGHLDESLQFAMDFDLWLRLIDAAIPSIYVQQTLATFHIHPASKTGSRGMDEFYFEEARALYKSGRPEIAQLALGRAAAHRALTGKAVSSRTLRRELQQMYDDGGELDRVAKRRMRAAAQTEAALLETQNSPKGLRHLLAVGPWRVAETRRRLTSAVQKIARTPFSFVQGWRE